MTATTLTKSMIALTAATLSLAAMSGATHAAGPEAREGRGGGWMMKRFDADGDGMISLQEFQAAGNAMFARLDADGDGRVSAEEWAAARPGRGWADGERRGQREAGAGPRGEDRAVHRAERMAQYRAARFANLDADGDGYVSRAEFDEARMARFNALDVNGNGVIDADELPQARGDRKGEGKGYGERERCRSK
jgi:Ca2+-binding EF-hand superfamily protein